MGERIREMFREFRPVSLEELNERASLQRRTDNKYLVSLDELARLTEALRDGHEVLEIDGERLFEYESTYFDTPGLQCFHDHIHDRRPRYKVRTRCYVTTGECFFEVKVKRDDDETVKRHVDYDPDERRTIQPRARELLSEMLSEFGVDEPDGELRPSLVTRFKRVTVVAADGPERTTFDFGVELDAPGTDPVALDPDYAIAETKTPRGEGAWDQALRDAGFEPISFSKYRVGMGLLQAPGEDAGYAADVKKLFAARARAGR